MTVEMPRQMPQASLQVDEASINQVLIEKVTALPLQAKQVLLRVLDKIPGASAAPTGNPSGLESAINSRVGV